MRKLAYAALLSLALLFSTTNTSFAAPSLPNPTSGTSTQRHEDAELTPLRGVPSVVDSASCDDIKNDVMKLRENEKRGFWLLLDVT